MFSSRLHHCTRSCCVLSACALFTYILFFAVPASAACTAIGADPSITICTPTNGDTVTSPVHVTAAAKSTAPVSFLQVYVDGIKVFQVSAATLDTSLTMAAGAHRLTVQGSNGTIFKTTENITVSAGGGGACTPSSTDSTIVICAPAANATVTSPVQVTAVATSAAAVQFMQVYVDGIKQFQQSGVKSVSTSLPIAGGTHRFTVQASNGTIFKTTETINVSSAPVVSVSVAPPTASIALSATQQFTATVQNTANTAVSWSVDGVPGGNATVGTIDASANPATYQAPATDGVHTITATSQADTNKSGNATVTVGTPPTPSFSGMFTYKYGNTRQGANTAETTLTTANVKSATFGKNFTYTVDGYVYAMPLYVPGVTIGGVKHNVVYIATEHDSVYAFDADGSTTTALWKKNYTDTAAGITTIPTADVGSTITSEIGITGTPVIDPDTNTLYVVVCTKEGTAYFQRLHALDLATGSEKFGGPKEITATVKGTGDGTDANGNVVFQPKIQLQRPALTLFNGAVYIAWASHGDNGPYHGWVLGYNATTLAQVAVHNNSPNARRGGIWMSGGGLAVDEAAGGIFYMSGNGTFTANTGGTAYGDSFVRLNATGAVTDYFTPFDQANMNAHDLDVSSGAVTVLPDQPGAHPHLIVGAGKTASIYLIDRDAMGHFNSVDNSQIVQYLPNALAAHCHTQPVYWNGNVYIGAETGPLYAFRLSNGLLSTAPISTTAMTFAFPGPNPTLSSNGNTNGILWAIDKPAAGGAVLRAYDASDLQTELYNSTQAGARDTLTTAVKFAPPLVANGRVYVPLKGQVAVFGLLQ